MTIKKLRTRVTADENIGKNLKPDQVLAVLDAGLTKLLGPFVHQRIKTLPLSGGLQAKVMAGKAGKAKSFISLMKSLDFTTIQNSTTSSYGASRLETNGGRTVVNYCSLAGIVVISTDIDIIDI